MSPADEAGLTQEVDAAAEKVAEVLLSLVHVIRLHAARHHLLIAVTVTGAATAAAVRTASTPRVTPNGRRRCHRGVVWVQYCQVL